MIVYLAELSHTGMGRSPNVVPLAAGYLAAFAKKYLPGLDIAIFRDPDLLLQAVEAKRPDIVGFSVHLWSERLSSFCAQRIKKISKNTVIVAGGPSVDDTDPEILRFMRLNRSFDVCIPNEGEIPFLRLLEHIQANGNLIKDQTIEGCATIASDNSLVRGEYAMPDLKEIPSPYLSGFLDVFLEDGYDPIIQSMRGCPYSCKFCVSGTSLWNKLRAFELDRVFKEFEYVKKRTKSNYLILTDENLGIMRERDVKLVEYIINSYNAGSFPRRLYFYSAKIITDHVLKVVEILAPIGEFGMSFQTLNEHVKKEICRTNITYEKFLEYVRWTTQRKIPTSTEMIFGFPYETVDSYIKGIEQLIVSGVDRVYSYNLRLFSGIDLASEESRKKYKFKVLYRLPERTYGCYGGSFVTETEEVVVGSNSFDYADYQKIRKYGLFLELSSGRGYLRELIGIMVKLGLPGEKLVTFLAGYKYNDHPNLLSVVRAYEEMANGELFATPEECIAYAHKIFSGGKPLPEVKLNLIYVGKIILNSAARKEFLAILKEFIRSHRSSQKQADFFTEYLDQVFINQIVKFDPHEERSVAIKTRIRLDKIEQNNYSCAEDLLSENPFSVRLDLHEDTVSFLKHKHLLNTDDDATLQDIYMSVSRFGLLRERNIES